MGIIGLCLWILFLPIRIALAPLRWLFGTPKRSEKKDDDDDFWTGFWMGSMF